MNTYRQWFRDKLTAVRTGFRGVAWINQDNTAASFFRFAHSELYKLTPGNVPDVFVYPTGVVSLQVDDVQGFKGDQLVGVDQFSRLFVRKVTAAIGDAPVYMVDRPLAIAI